MARARLSTRDRRFRQLAAAVAAGEGPHVAGRRLGLDWATVAAWGRFTSFRVLVEVLRSDAARLNEVERPNAPAPPPRSTEPPR